MKFLYRYYGNMGYAFDVLKNKRLYFSLQSEFNDPYDCLPKFSLLACKGEGLEVWTDFLKNVELYLNPEIEEALLEQNVDKTLNGQSHPSISWLKEYEQERRTMLETFLNRIRICCFSRSARNQMLWAHYAKNHKGLIFQFRKKYMADGDSGEPKDYPVSYYDKPITLKQYNEIFKSGTTNPLEYARFQYCSKSLEWAGEGEVRYFSHCDYVKFKEEMLTGVIFGSKTPPYIIDTIRCLVRDWKNKPWLFIESEIQTSYKQIFRTI